MSELNPGLPLLSKLGSIVGHVEEMRSPDGHHFDAAAIDGLLADPEVQAWLVAMRKMALIPQPRRSK